MRQEFSGMSHFQLNFFSVVIPDGIELPILVRDLAEGEQLQPHEYLFPAKGEVPLPRVAAVVDHLEVGTESYTTRKCAVRDLTTGVIRRLLEKGLQRAFVGKGLIVERALTEFYCYRPDDYFSTDTPTFLRIRRGVQLRCDCIFATNRRVFGFFVSTKSRVYFEGGVTRPEVAEAALGTRVWFESDRGARAGTLLQVSNGSARLMVTEKVDKPAVEISVAPGSIEVPGSLEVLRAYCRKLPSGAAVLKQALAAPKRAAGRITASGTKNSKWAVYEFDQVAMWLNSVSTLGRIAFQWPNSTVEVALDVHPADLRQTS